MKKLLDWFSNTGLYAIALFLLAFIPLYPKLPLIDIAQTWAYIRLEDFLVAIACVVLILVKLRGRKFFQTPLNVPIVTYFIVVGISLINALLFIFPKFPTDLLPHLAFLHYARRIEYISVFFLAFEAFRRKPKLWGIIAVLSGTYLMVLLYGFGQKFLGFPAFLTMNEEFAKGVPLRLPSTARIPSTFGGHYDLGAFLVFVIPIMGSLVFAVRKWYLKILYVLLWLGGLIVLLFTASRISFGVYLVAVSMMLVWQKKAILIIPVIALSILILNLTSGASERFYKTFRVSNVVVDLSTGKPIGTLEKLEGKSVTLEKIEEPDEESLPKGSGFINVPAKTDVPVVQDIQKVEYFTTKDLTKASGEVATISGSFLIQKALVYDISITTRFQGQWPKAMEAFRRNIVLGSGFSSLSLAADGDYHRMLGETGLLGAIAFLGIFVVSFSIFFKTKDQTDTITKALSIGVFAGLCGLFCNAVLIDVFEASKVAFTFWLVLGFTLAALTQEHTIKIDYWTLMKKLLTHPFAYSLYLVLAVFLIWRGVFSLYFIGDDFTWTRWAAESSFPDIIRYFTRAQGFFYRPLPKIWYFILFSVFWLKPFAYHVASLFLVSGIVLVMYRILMLLRVRTCVALGTAFVFITLSVHHENIFWISGQSSILAGFFLILSMMLFLEGESRPQKQMKALRICSIGAVLGSMLCYDGMLVAPLAAFLTVRVISKQWKPYAWVVLLIPLYLLLRFCSGAVDLSGDYGYKWKTLFVNSIGNGSAYMLSFIFGPIALEWMEQVRKVLKTFILPVSAFGVFIVGLIGFIITRLRRKIESYNRAIVFFISGLLLFSAYAGLGNASERYVFIPSIFILLSAGIAFEVWLSKKRSHILLILMIVCVAILSWWNIRQVQRLAGDWRTASDITQQTLLKIKKETFPPLNLKSFFFVNMPIRYGRAWIFPNGLTDAIWHIYRQNQFRVYIVPSIQSGYEQSIPYGDREVFIFENYELKRGIREERILEVPYNASTP